MTNKTNYREIFQESNSYCEMLLKTTLYGGNKAQMNKFLQDAWTKYYEYEPFDHRLPYVQKVTLFIKEGICNNEIPMKFLWNMLGCPKNIDEVNAKLKELIS